jgi:hypothetical protein
LPWRGSLCIKIQLAFGSFAIGTDPFVHSLSVFEREFELAEETYDFVAVSALFGFQRDVSAHDAGGVFDEFLLELIQL